MKGKERKRSGEGVREGGRGIDKEKERGERQREGERGKDKERERGEETKRGRGRSVERGRETRRDTDTGCHLHLPVCEHNKCVLVIFPLLDNWFEQVYLLSSPGIVGYVPSCPGLTHTHNLIWQGTGQTG